MPSRINVKMRVILTVILLGAPSYVFPCQQPLLAWFPACEFLLQFLGFKQVFVLNRLGIGRFLDFADCFQCFRRAPAGLKVSLPRERYQDNCKNH
jgi:hypothetical protein